MPDSRVSHASDGRSRSQPLARARTHDCPAAGGADCAHRQRPDDVSRPRWSSLIMTHAQPTSDRPWKRPGRLWAAGAQPSAVCRSRLLKYLLMASLLYVLFAAGIATSEHPLAFSSDTLWYLMQSKGTVDNGWWWWNPRLGAPFGLDAAGVSLQQHGRSSVWSGS